MKLLAASALVVLTAAGGCAGRAATRAQGSARGPESTPHVLRIKTEFEAEYRVFGRTAIPPGAEVPLGRSPVRRTRICAYERRGRNDFAADAHEINDRRLGCGSTDDDGLLEIPLARDKCREGLLCHRRVYLITDLCVMHHGDPQVCVVANTDQGGRMAATPWTKHAEFRKFMWSETYDVSLMDRTSTLITWNMSCPGERGEGRDGFRCDRPEREGRWGRANSNIGFNKDAVHALQAGAQAVRKFGRLAPRASTTSGPGGMVCGGKGDRHKKASQCQDAIRLVIDEMRRVLMDGDKRCARRRKAKDRAASIRTACLAHPMNPFIVVHEMGHLAHIRWMSYRGPINAGKVDWSSGADQRSQVGEGWADFYAAAAWYAPDAEQPTFNSRNVENASDSLLWSTCQAGKPLGEGRASQFFWDLYDAPSDTEPGDRIQLPVATMLQVWSMFRGGNASDDHGDHTKGECGPHGRNVFDFLHYYRQYQGGRLPDPAGLLPLNCMSGQLNGVRCGGR